MKLHLCTHADYVGSGVPSLGEVPAHWKVRRLGQMGRIWKGRGGSKADETSAGVPCVRYGDLYTSHEFFIQSTRSAIPETAAENYTPIEFGDVLFASSGETIEEIGKAAVNLMRLEARCGGDVLVFRSRYPVDARYLGYTMGCHPVVVQKAAMGRGITIMHIYADRLKRLVLPLPPLPEQTAIARFLGYVDGRVQRTIREKERLLALLDEQRLTVIEQAVTGQINVRTGKPFAAYKNSGVEWLPKVPAHWELRRSKRLFRPRRERSRPGDIQLSATQAYGVIAQAEYEERIGRKVTKITRNLKQRRHVEVDDFVISMRSFQGGLERAWQSGCIRSSYVVLQAIAPLDVGYFGRLFKSRSYIAALQSTANFIRDGQDLNFENFAGVDLPFPPPAEQREITEAIGREAGQTSSKIRVSRRQIALLREYRARLIADVVTGKVDIRETAVDLPEVDPLGTVSSGTATPESS